MSEPERRRSILHSRWAGPILVITCAAIGLIGFGTLSVYRFVYGWSAEFTELDKAPVVSIGGIRGIFPDLAVRRDRETWTKRCYVGRRCEITYQYDHPDFDQPLELESRIFTEPTRRDSFLRFNELCAQFIAEYASRLPGSAYSPRDEELSVPDQSRFGSYAIEGKTVAFFFARRRGLHVYVGYFRANAFPDNRIREIFAAPIENLDDWNPDQ